MVAGCSMGAGCLAMPLLSAGPNFIFSSIFLIIAGILSYFIAIASLELFIVYKNNANITTIVNYNFGKFAVLFTMIINGMLMYALLSVYMSGGADLLNKTVFPIFSVKMTTNHALLIFLILAIPVFTKGASLVIQSNKIIFWIKLVTFLCVVSTGLFFLSDRLYSFVLTQIKYIPHAFPVLFGALWFHFLIPIIAKINNYNRDTCKRVFKIGLILPTTLYITWVAIMLSLIPRSGANSFYTLLSSHSSVGGMISLALSNNPHVPRIMKIALDLFSNIALLTSFLTVGLSTYDYMRDACKINQTKIGVILTLFITMTPPVLLVLLFPNSFIMVLQQAIILLMITNLITFVCLLKQYKTHDVQFKITGVYFLMMILIGLIGLQVVDNFKLLPIYS